MRFSFIQIKRVSYYCIIILVYCMLFFFVSCSMLQSYEYSPPSIALSRFDEQFATLIVRVKEMSNEALINQIMLVGIDGKTTVDPAVKKFLQRYTPGGILLFHYNVSNTVLETKNFIAEIQNVYAEKNAISPFIAIDHEGGEVNRLRGILDIVPSAESVAQTNSFEKAQRIYEATAEQLADMGITLNLAPVLEPISEQNKAFLGSRSFGTSEKVVSYGAIFIESFQNKGIIASAKHFPGNTADDPHFGLPRIMVPYERLEKDFIAPFVALFNADATAQRPRAVLLSHAIVTAVDSEYPACLSHKLVSGELRKKLKYTGLILSDDVRMAALEKNGFPPEKAAVLAVNAGVNMIMLSGGDIAAIHTALSNEIIRTPLFRYKLEESVYRILEAKRFINEKS